MTFNEYLNLGIENFSQIFEYYLKYLEEFSSKNFPFDEQLKLKGAGNKFINSIDRTAYINQERKSEYLKIIDELYYDLRKYRRIDFSVDVLQLILGPSKKSLLLKIQDSFQNLYSFTLELINETKYHDNYYDNLKINDFYKPDMSNKQKIKDLINEAIKFIKDDDTLSKKSKNIIIDYLDLTIKELDRENVNWTRFLGRIKEAIIVLSALGSIVGGATAIFTAKEKLEQTNIIIERTSINLNYNILNETFNVSYIHDSSSINRLLEMDKAHSMENQIPNKTNNNEE